MGAKESRPVSSNGLEDRLKLAVDCQIRGLPGYALVAAKSGYKLKPVDPGEYGCTDSKSVSNVVTLTGTKASMADLADLADWVAGRVGAVVMEKTGAPEVYD